VKAFLRLAIVSRDFFVKNLRTVLGLRMPRPIRLLFSA
jgi:hypothetical protein